MRYLIKKPDTFLNSLNNEINTILHRNFDTIFPEYAFQKEIKGLSMPVDIKEYDSEYKVKIEVPGIKREDLNLEINKSYLKISAKKEEETEEKNSKFHKTEFRYGDFERVIYYPEEVDVENSEAKLEHGVLNLHLPKLKPTHTETKKMEIK